jgi:phage terminase small subunit
MAEAPSMRGGARVGAGRKPKPEKAPAQAPGLEPLAFLLAVVQGAIDPTPLQVRAAIAAAQYRHKKRGDGGLKEEAAEKAKKATTQGSFRPSAPPLHLIKRSKDTR